MGSSQLVSGSHCSLTPILPVLNLAPTLTPSSQTAPHSLTHFTLASNMPGVLLLHPLAFELAFCLPRIPIPFSHLL
jgi:hypothetical protein